jgi:hypothetical protein
MFDHAHHIVEILRSEKLDPVEAEMVFTMALSMVMEDYRKQGEEGMKLWLKDVVDDTTKFFDMMERGESLQ